jgi:hypothetical protein
MTPPLDTQQALIEIAIWAGKVRASRPKARAPGEVPGRGEVLGVSHRHFVNRNHLRHQHGLDGVSRWHE